MFLAIVFWLASAAQASEWPCSRYGLEEGLDPSDALEQIPFEVLYHYRQADLDYDDPIADYAIAARGKQVTEKLSWEFHRKQDKIDEFNRRILASRACSDALFGLEPMSRPSESDEPWQASPEEFAAVLSARLTLEEQARALRMLEEGKLRIDGTKNPLDSDGFVAMVVEIIRLESSITPSLGTPHDWNPEIRQRYWRRFFPVMETSKVFAALVLGMTSRFLATGQERALEAFILAQARGSVEPAMVLRESYLLNRGDLYLTLLTIENVLNQYWRHPTRDHLELTRRLKRITNFLGPGSDQYGAWYHLFGIMLYGYVDGAVQATAVGTIEDLGSRILAHGRRERQEHQINRHGGRIGALLRRALRERRHLTAAPDPDALRMERYLPLDEDFTRALREAVRR